TVAGKNTTIEIPDSNLYYISVASVNFAGTESLFSDEKMQVVLSANQSKKVNNEIQLYQNIPNPFDEVTYIPILVNNNQINKGTIVITDLNGNVVFNKTINLHQGLNEFPYHHGFGKTGAYFYTLWVSQKPIATKTMIFAY